MRYKLGNFTILIENDYEAMSKRAAWILAAQIIKKPSSNIGLATGGTPVGTYKELINLYKEGIIDFSNISTFNLDEYYPISKDNEQSYNFYMNHNLFSHVNLNASKINIPNGESKNVEKECHLYEKKLMAAGGLDFQLLGIGNNGHIAFNEPNDFFEPLTHVVSLDQKTIEANARFFESIDSVPRQAISMGIQSILSAKRILLIANGSNKSAVIKKMIFDKITPCVPASILQVHHHVTVVLTEDAAVGIRNYL